MTEPFTDSANALLALQNHPVLVIVYILLVLAIVFMVLVIKAPKLFQRKKQEKKERIEKIVLNSDLDGSVSERRCLGRREDDKVKLSGLVDAMMHKIEAMTLCIKNDTMRSCIALIYTSRVPIGYKLSAAIDYFVLEGNGNVRDRTIELIRNEPNGIQHWRTALHQYTQQHGTVDNAYFNKTINYIEQEATKGMMIS